MEFQEGRYYTSDVDLAAYLLTHGFSYQGIEMDGQRGFFVFLKAKHLPWTVASFHDEASPGEAPAKPYAQARTRLYREVREALQQVRAAR